MIFPDTKHDECVTTLRRMCERLCRLALIQRALREEWWGDAGLIAIYDEDIASQRRAIERAVRIKPWLAYLVDQFIKDVVP